MAPKLVHQRYHNYGESRIASWWIKANRNDGAIPLMSDNLQPVALPPGIEGSICTLFGKLGKLTSRREEAERFLKLTEGM